MNSLRLIVLVGLVGLVVVSCTPQPLPQAPTPIPTLIPATLPAATAPGAAAAGGAAGAAPQSPQYAQGQQIWQANCTPCHKLTTEKLVGPGLAGLFNAAQLPNGKPFNEPDLIDWLKTGGSLMPGFGATLSDDELDALVSFLKEATAVAGAAGPTAAVTGEPLTAEPATTGELATAEPAGQPATTEELATVEPAGQPAATGEPATAEPITQPEATQPVEQPTAASTP